MKVTYQTCCGVDVHKSFLVATTVKTTGGIEPSHQKKRFSTFNNSILGFKQSGTSINHEEIASKLLRSLKSKEDAVIESVEGYQMTDAQKYRMRLVRAHMRQFMAFLYFLSHYYLSFIYNRYIHKKQGSFTQ